MQEIGKRSAPFSLSGKGTKKIPIARPQVIVDKKGKPVVFFRDEERGSRVSVAMSTKLSKAKWKMKDLTSASVGDWEPAFDTELWKKQEKLHLYVQNVVQADGEGIAKVQQQTVYILEWKP